ncbi:MAG TPA: hypothetical protein VG826_18195 [Pirellulales bacterium]|nr:hypothetical protein [Pirellulales bacterium]
MLREAFSLKGMPAVALPVVLLTAKPSCLSGLAMIMLATLRAPAGISYGHPASHVFISPFHFTGRSSSANVPCHSQSEVRSVFC